MKKIALAATLLCSAGTTLAQEVINPSWYVGPTVLAIKPDHDFGIGDNDWGGGLKFGKPVTPMWDIQFGATEGRTENGFTDYRQTAVGVDGLLMLSRRQLRPFLLVGVGGQRDRVSQPGRKVSGWSPYYSAGLGFQASLNDRWTFQFDARANKGHLRKDDEFGFSKSLTKYLGISLLYAFNPPPSLPAPAPVVQPTPVVEAPAPAPAPVAPPPPPPARFEKVTLSSTELFGFDSATLTMPQPKLDEIAAALQADPSITDVDITGYTDRLGSTKYNQKLSERRANAVREYLVGKGVDAKRLKAYGKGEQNPVVTDCKQKKRSALIECLAPNRRVEVEQITVERRVQ
jgi:OOP family OmpA-OmpF porin